MATDLRAPLERPRVVVRASEAPPPREHPPRPRFETLHGVGAAERDVHSRRPATLRPDVDEALADSYRAEALSWLAAHAGA